MLSRHKTNKKVKYFTKNSLIAQMSHLAPNMTENSTAADHLASGCYISPAGGETPPVQVEISCFVCYNRLNRKIAREFYDENLICLPWQDFPES